MEKIRLGGARNRKGGMMDDIMNGETKCVLGVGRRGAICRTHTKDSVRNVKQYSSQVGLDLGVDAR